MTPRNSCSSVRLLLTSALVTLAACMPAANQSNEESQAAASPANKPFFKSAKTISSTCAAAYYAGGPPGFAVLAGRQMKDMPPPMVKMLSVGDGREKVATDINRVAPGYTLIEPGASKTVFLIDNELRTVASFEYENLPGLTEILPNGHRLVSSNRYSERFREAGGVLGCMEEYSATGELLWRLNLTDDRYTTHHDFARMENGNILAIVWESVTTNEAVEQGRDPQIVAEDGDFWYDGVIEINPYTAQIVWEWSARHHLVQEFDENKENYALVADHPELLDINLHRLGESTGKVSADWSHVNSIDYNEELDQILLSSNYLSEIWVIDHSTTPYEAEGHKGGRYGKGGDFLYRWGNPENYGRGAEEDRRIFHQHDAQWIRQGLNGAGNILLFNNGHGELHPYSTVVELTPPLDADDSYVLQPRGAYGPQELAWEYNPEPPAQFHSFFISGAQRLPNGNTLVNQGAGAKVREVTPEGEIVWEYRYTDYGVPPDMLFRANRYPPDHPGIAKILLQN